MARSDSSRLQVFYMPEVTPGTVPATALRALRVTGIGGGGKKDTVTSDELREDRQISDITEVGASAEASFPFEYSYGTFHELLAGLCMNAWTAPVTITGSSNITFTSGTSKITNPSGTSGLDFT